MAFLAGSVVYALVLILFFQETQSSFIYRYRSNLAFYGGYSTGHRSVLYTNSELEDWKNLEKLAVEAGLEQKALICGLGKGAWLAYPMANFQSANNGSNYAMLLVGDTCIPADNINSIQPVAQINKEPTGLVTFTEPFFTSEASWLTNETNTASGVKSFVCPAGLSGEWTVEGDGQKVCVVRPKDLIATGVCIFPDVDSQLKIKSATVTIGCPDRQSNSSGNGTDGGGGKVEDGTKVITLQTCFKSFGAYKIIDDYFPLPQVQALCQDNADESHKFGFFKILDAWKFRMDTDRRKEENPANIDLKRTKDKYARTRLDIMNKFFEIFKKSCKNVPDDYHDLIRYVFMQHIKSVWEEMPNTITDKDNNRLTWTEALKFLTECSDQRDTDNPVKIPKELECIERKQYGKEHNNPESWDDWELPALDLFLTGDTLDHVIEQTWLMSAYVGPYCASNNRYPNNEWVEFQNLFRRNFLMPVLQQWLHPGTWQVLYDYMFNGYSITKMKRVMISCIQDMLLRVEGPDPVDRPSATVDEFLNLSKKKLPVEPADLLKLQVDSQGRSKATLINVTEQAAGVNAAAAPAGPTAKPAAAAPAAAGTAKPAVAGGPTTKSPKKSRKKRNLALLKKKAKTTKRSAQKLMKQEKQRQEEEKEKKYHENGNENAEKHADEHNKHVESYHHKGKRRKSHGR